MEYLRHIEEDLVNLGNEAKKKYPEIKDSTDKALISLKSIRGYLLSSVLNVFIFIVVDDMI